MNLVAEAVIGNGNVIDLDVLDLDCAVRLGVGGIPCALGSLREAGQLDCRRGKLPVVEGKPVVDGWLVELAGRGALRRGARKVRDGLGANETQRGRANVELGKRHAGLR